MSSWYQWQENDLILLCHLQPRASADEFAGLHGDALKIRIKATPVDGKANSQLIGFLAKAFGVGKSHISIEKGDASRTKRIRIRSPQKIPAKLNLNKL